MSTAFTFDDLRAELADPAHRRVVPVRILLRQDLLNRHDELERRLADELVADGRENREPVAPVIAEQIEALEREIDEARREFVFAPVGHRAWADLLRDHPPTAAVLKQFPGLDHDPETFPVAAIAASCIAPALTVEQARELEQLVNQAQWQMLWAACLEANLGGGATPKSAAAGMIRRRSGGSATTAASEGSLAASSSAE